jgi:hypothetical protein
LAGTWSLNFNAITHTCTSSPANLCSGVDDNPVTEPATIQQNGTQLVMTFTGTPTAGALQSFYTWSGQVTGSQVTFHTSYNGPVTYQGVTTEVVDSFTLTGSVLAANHMSGTFTESLSETFQSQQESISIHWNGDWTATRSSP